MLNLHRDSHGFIQPYTEINEDNHPFIIEESKVLEEKLLNRVTLDNMTVVADNGDVTFQIPDKLYTQKFLDAVLDALQGYIDTYCEDTYTEENAQKHEHVGEKLWKLSRFPLTPGTKMYGRLHYARSGWANGDGIDITPGRRIAIRNKHLATIK